MGKLTLAVMELCQPEAGEALEECLRRTLTELWAANAALQALADRLSYEAGHQRREAIRYRNTARRLSRRFQEQGADENLVDLTRYQRIEILALQQEIGRLLRELAERPEGPAAVAAADVNWHTTSTISTEDSTPPRPTCEHTLVGRDAFGLYCKGCGRRIAMNGSQES